MRLLMIGLKEKCGIFGVYGEGLPVSKLTYFGLFALQHRGQESSGIAVADKKEIRVHKGPGLVAQVFSEEVLGALTGHVAIGHNRYSTSKGSDPKHAQPIVSGGAVAFAHNGNLPSTRALEAFLTEKGVPHEGYSDSALMTEAIGWHIKEGKSLQDAVRAAYPLFTGAFSIVVMTKDGLVAARDPKGVRPLCLARLPGGFVVSSETCALPPVGATFLREVLPGEMVVITASGVSSEMLAKGEQKLDIFEFIYFARHDSHLLGKSVYDVRKAFGRKLFEEHPVKADVVIGVPETSMPAALGYAQASGIPFEMGLNKNRYIQRTFIQPDQQLRDKSVRMKLTPIPEVIAGKRVVVIDDSVVRGTTSKHIVELLYEAGAKEVHFLVSSPPIRFPDFYGIDTPLQSELFAFQKTLQEMHDFFGATSLHFLSLPGMLSATGLSPELFNTSCFSGEYPIALGERAREVSNVT